MKAQLPQGQVGLANHLGLDLQASPERQTVCYNLTLCQIRTKDLRLNNLVKYNEITIIIKRLYELTFGPGFPRIPGKPGEP